MPSVGPSLPPELSQKRKRGENGDEPKRPISPTQSSSDEKRRRVIGPTLPPAPLDERPTGSPSGSLKITPKPASNGESDSDSESDDDFGPALPPVGAAAKTHENRESADAANQTTNDPSSIGSSIDGSSSKPQREDWMLVPPSELDWGSRVDPTKLKNRKFNTGKGAKGPSQTRGGGGGSDNTLWTETPEQRKKRLEDEVMGVRKPAQNADNASLGPKRNEAEDRSTDKRIREYNDKYRNSSLYDEHRKAKPGDLDDDPSKRAFDKEKDIRGGIRIDGTKRKEIMSRAADFGSRFSKGSYL